MNMLCKGKKKYKMKSFTHKCKKIIIHLWVREKSNDGDYDDLICNSRNYLVNNKRAYIM